MRQSQIEAVRERLNQLLWEPNGQPTHFLKTLVEGSFDRMISEGDYLLTDAEEGVKHFKAEFLIKGFDLNFTLQSK